MTPTKQGIRKHAMHLSQKTLHDARSRMPLKNMRGAFLLCAVLYLSLYHLRQEVVNFHAFQGTSDSAVDTSVISHFHLEESLNALQPSGMDNLSLLRSYLPRNDPVLGEYKPSSKRPVQVHFWTGSLDIHTSTKFLLEGVERSQYLNLVHISFVEPHLMIKSLEVVRRRDRKAPLIWMVDLLALEHDCHALEALLSHALELNKKHRYKLRPHVLMIDYSGSSNTPKCSTFQEKLAKANGIQVRVAQRGILRNRVWDDNQNWVNMGHVIPNRGKKLLLAGNILHSPFPVREMIVTTVSELIEIQRQELSLPKLRPVDTKRSNDIAFFWRKGDNAHYANLRRIVAQTVSSLQAVDIGNRKLKTFVRYVGDDEFMGKTDVISRDYVKEMLGTKVIVVAQRDEWEDHYRLMESFAAGALVFSDAMIGAPEGLIHQKTVIFYNGTDSLREQLIYYLDQANVQERLSIAKKGWELVMGRHRCWHRVEELLFGAAKTSVNAAYGAPPVAPVRGVQTKRGKKSSATAIEFPVERVVDKVGERSE